MLAALLFTSAVTLGVAALLLFSPLEERLRSDGESLVFGAINSTRPEFEEIKLDPRSDKPDEGELATTVRLLRRRSGGQVTVLDESLTAVYSPARLDLDVPDYYAQARQALDAHRRVSTLLGEQLTAAQPTHIGFHGGRYVVIVTRRLEYVTSAVRAVQNAFLVAAGVGLAIALVLGLWLTRTLLRRLERLRDSTQELIRSGLDAPAPADGHRDEIGDLARAFANMQARLHHQEQARRAFVATASHELRTPLASLDGTLELLADDLQPERLDVEDARERIGRAREQSRRLSNLASDLLDLSRLDAEVQLRTEPVELGELCRAVAAEFEQRATDANVALQANLSSGQCWALADPGALARIVRILLDNALGVAPGGSSVILQTQTGGGRAQLLVSDSGPGVPLEERERIFERFQRGSITGGRAGFGLGLAIGRELTERMGGELVLVDRKTVGGACFAVRLPRAQVDEDDDERGG
jgi:signal transduction histidine kinase